jgi:hypothetical protein
MGAPMQNNMMVGQQEPSLLDSVPWLFFSSLQCTASDKLFCIAERKSGSLRGTSEEDHRKLFDFLLSGTIAPIAVSHSVLIDWLIANDLV